MSYPNDHVAGAEDTFIMHRASEPNHVLLLLLLDIPSSFGAPEEQTRIAHARRAVRIAASRSSKVARLQPRAATTMLYRPDRARTCSGETYLT